MPTAGRRLRWPWLLAAALAAACGRAAPTHPPGTGAEAKVKDYCEVIVRQDYDRAFADLDPDSQAAFGPGRFARRAAAYRAGLGFEPDAVHVRSCEEHGDSAIAHIVFAGAAGSQHRSYQDGVVLRRTAAGWGVVPPARPLPGE